ncbi:hypothetical protein [Actinosynnema sp. NPDC020468]|uniref:hypothetical protein n=1 Tax=Actinosynnema sp. NPDC020468 TaxID=3154488 RepID=UPI0033E76194
MRHTRSGPVPADRRDDPFAVALRAAIRARGLGLDRIQQRLRGSGAAVSVATLSYWQSGRRRPERPDSLAALKHLEVVLEVPPGSLTALLGAPRPRGRVRQVEPVPPLERMWSSADRVASLLAGVDVRSDDALTRINLHVVVEIAPDRGLRRITTRQVLRAEQDGPDRWISVHDMAASGAPTPEVIPLQSCDLGRVIRQPGVVAAELLFDRALARGETIVIEHASVLPGPPFPRGDDSYCRVFRHPVRDYVVELRFDPAALPRACYHYSTRPENPEPHHRRHMPVSAAGHAHAVALGFGPGGFSVRWDWPDHPSGSRETHVTPTREHGDDPAR